ncbi:hypothetical protein KC343_g7290 [Hortaea werneckii]|uniref:Uncharacterized protein n=1 Tax=Hortaea werneckii TaxID=91943 RepID=A0A3M7GTV1_HORWE|nr:hypothetical protein KC323_g7173 [Hortaea werneckii]KAI6861581.1 hypothetical protein KC338_g6571 [Hortaea werneckii]KAI7238504.1 hypothetical protein KC352_g14885 [Hortaea werneckii]KAI7347889.1 hypothetical protein KC320_g6983 [Hortaea werneckii]KAI7563659.1 hypothetical protein KC317_g7590 [Hortaea werneckii]
MAAERKSPSESFEAIFDTLNRMDEQFDRMDERLDRIDQNCANITARMSASDYNDIARIQNSLLRGPNDAITPLRNPSTNAAIPAFPATPGAINQLPAAAVNTLLTALEQRTDGSIAARRERIGIAIGLAVKRNVSEAP